MRSTRGAKYLNYAENRNGLAEGDGRTGTGSEWKVTIKREEI